MCNFQFPPSLSLEKEKKKTQQNYFEEDAREFDLFKRQVLIYGDDTGPDSISN